MIHARMYVCMYVIKDPEVIQQTVMSISMQSGAVMTEGNILLVDYFTVSIHFILIISCICGNKVR